MQSNPGPPTTVQCTHDITVVGPSLVRLPRHAWRPSGVTRSNLVALYIGATLPVRPVTGASSVDLKSPREFQAANGLRFLHLNVRSLLPKIDFINVLVNDAAPDVFVISESWLSGRIPNSDVALNGYNLFRIDRKAKGKGGRVVMFVREHLAAHVLAVSSECIVLDICVGGDSHIVVIGVYRFVPKLALEDFGKIMSTYVSSELVVLGDLNLDWLSESSISLKQLCLELNLSQLIQHPTRPNTKNHFKSTLIDIVITNRPLKYPQSGVFAQGISGHCPIACVRVTKAIKSKGLVLRK